MTIPTYTQSDMEALRERCVDIIVAEIFFIEHHCGEEDQRIAVALKSLEQRLAVLPITPRTEEEKKP